MPKNAMRRRIIKAQIKKRQSTTMIEYEPSTYSSVKWPKRKHIGASRKRTKPRPMNHGPAPARS